MLAWAVAGELLIIMAATTSTTVLVVAAAVMGVCIPMANVTTTQQVCAAASGADRALAMTTQGALVNGASTAGLIAAGAAMAAVGPRVPLACAGLLILLTAALAVRFTRRRRGPPAHPTINQRERPSQRAVLGGLIRAAVFGL